MSKRWNSSFYEVENRGIYEVSVFFFHSGGALSYASSSS